MLLGFVVPSPLPLGIDAATTDVVAGGVVVSSLSCIGTLVFSPSPERVEETVVVVLVVVVVLAIDTEVVSSDCDDISDAANRARNDDVAAMGIVIAVASGDDLFVDGDNK